MDFSFRQSQKTQQDNLNIQQMTIAQNNLKTAQRMKKESEKFVMPEAENNYSRVIAYLNKTRKIPHDIIQEFIKSGKLYQEKKTGNAVFLHSKYGENVGAEIHGTHSDIRYKGVAKGTRDSVFSFSFSQNPKDIKQAYVFESAIDLMSFYALVDRNKNNLEGVAFISMAGLKPKIIKEIESRGIEIFSCVDNDKDGKGKKFTEDNGFKNASELLEKEGVKDWNDLLKKYAGTEKNKSLPEEKNAQTDNPRRAGLKRKRRAQSKLSLQKTDGRLYRNGE